MAKSKKNEKRKEDHRPAETTSAATEVKSASKAPPKTSPKAKQKSAAERRKDRIDGIIKTVFPSVLGVLAGFVCFYGGSAVSQLPWHFVLLVLILATYVIQKLAYPFLRIDIADFQGKDWFYVEFMVIDLWLVTWTLLLN
jgi:Flp pilus assembly protein TadB